MGRGISAFALGGLVALGCSFDATSQGSEGTSSSGRESTGGAVSPDTSSSGMPPGTTDAAGTTDVADDTTTSNTGSSDASSSTTASDGGSSSGTHGGPAEVEYCTIANLPIPSDDRNGVGSDLEVDLAGGGTVVSLELIIVATHTWVGDLRFDLRKGDADVLVIDRPDGSRGDGDCGGDDIDVALRDDAATMADDACVRSSPALSGTLAPANPMDPVFAGTQMVGTWRLRATDTVPEDSGTLDSWCLRITYR